MPHSLELERTVLAVLLDGRHATAIHTVREFIEHPLVFYERNHRLVYQACLDLDDEGERIDASAVAERLRRCDFQVCLDRLRRQQMLLEADELDGMGRERLRSLYRFRSEDRAENIDDSALAAIDGFAGLSAIAASYASAAGLRQNARLLRDYYLKRRLITRLGGIADDAYRTTEDFDDLVDTASTGLLKISRLGRKGAVHAVADVVTETLDEIGRRQAEPDTELLTGYRTLDDKLGSLRSGGLYVLAARPGVGKTSFALNVVQNILEGDGDDEVRTLFFSLEVDRRDLVKKLISAKADIAFRKIETGMLTAEESDALAAAAEDLRGLRLDLMDVSDLNVAALRSVAKRHILECDGRLGLIVLDYLQLLNGRRGDMTEYEKVSEISRTLKIMARELELPVLALSQMHRESERSAKPREPRLSDLRGSGSIEQDADAVLFLHRVDDGDDETVRDSGRDVKVIVAKNRFGPTGALPMKFFPERQRFAMSVMLDEEVPGRGAPPPPRDSRFERPPGDDEDLFT